MPTDPPRTRSPPPFRKDPATRGASRSEPPTVPTMSKTSTCLLIALPLALILGLGWYLHGALQGPDLANLSGDETPAPPTRTEAELQELALRKGPEEARAARTLEHFDDPKLAATFDRSSLWGTVSDEEGAPVIEASVALFTDEASRLYPDSDLQRATQTDELGRFSFTGLTPFETYRVLVRGDGFGPAVQRERAGRSIEFELVRAYPLEGTVIAEASGEAEAGVELYLARRRSSIGMARETRSGSDGHYGFDDLRRGNNYQIYARRPGYFTQRFEVETEEDGPTHYDVRLAPGIRVIGRVTDAGSGKPIQGAEVWAGDREVLTQSDAEGGFEVLGVAGREPELHVSAPGYASLRRRVDMETAADSTLLEFPLIRAGVIEGIVRNADGDPVAGALVTPRIENARGGWNRNERTVEPTAAVQSLQQLSSGDGDMRLSAGSDLDPTKTDAQGRFHIEGLASRTGRVTARVRVEAEGYAQVDSEQVTLELPAGSGEIEVILEASVRIHGFVFVDDRPVEASLRLDRPGPDNHIVSNAAGEYEFEAALVGSRAIDVTLDANRLVRERIELDLIPGEDLELDIHMDSNLETIEGIVQTPSGRPVPDARVWASAEQRRGRSSLGDTTDSRGRFVIELPRNETETTYRVGVTQGPVSESVRGVLPGARDLELSLPELGWLSLQVHDTESGQAIPRVRVEWRATGGEFREYRAGGRNRDLSTGENGRVDMEIPVGEVDLRVSSPEGGYGAKLVPGLTASASENPLPYPVGLERGVDVTLSFGTPSPELGQLVLIRPEDADSLSFIQRGDRSFPRTDRLSEWDWGRQMLRVNDEGQARVIGLARGSWRLASSVPGTFTPAEFSLVPGVANEFVVHWSPIE